jgi:hypothetical protein
VGLEWGWCGAGVGLEWGWSEKLGDGGAPRYEPGSLKNTDNELKALLTRHAQGFIAMHRGQHWRVTLSHPTAPTHPPNHPPAQHSLFLSLARGINHARVGDTPRAAPPFFLRGLPLVTSRDRLFININKPYVTVAHNDASHRPSALPWPLCRRQEMREEVWRGVATNAAGAVRGGGGCDAALDLAPTLKLTLA